MKVLIVDTMTPFTGGNHDLVVQSLASELGALGHDSEVLRIPISFVPIERGLSQALLVRWLEVEYVDHVIALGYPACLVRHERKTAWLHFENGTQHLFTGLLCPESADAHANTRSTQTMSEMLRRALAEARNLYVDSSTGQECLLQYSGSTAEVLAVPASEPRKMAPSWATSVEALLR